jgi:hypothetical protein
VLLQSVQPQSTPQTMPLAKHSQYNLRHLVLEQVHFFLEGFSSVLGSAFLTSVIVGYTVFLVISFSNRVYSFLAAFAYLLLDTTTLTFLMDLDLFFEGLLALDTLRSDVSPNVALVCECLVGKVGFFIKILVRDCRKIFVLI